MHDVAPRPRSDDERHLAAPGARLCHRGERDARREGPRVARSRRRVEVHRRQHAEPARRQLRRHDLGAERRYRLLRRRVVHLSRSQAPSSRDRMVVVTAEARGQQPRRRPSSRGARSWASSKSRDRRGLSCAWRMGDRRQRRVRLVLEHRLPLEERGRRRPLMGGGVCRGRSGRRVRAPVLRERRRLWRRRRLVRRSAK